MSRRLLLAACAAAGSATGPAFKSVGNINAIANSSSTTDVPSPVANGDLLIGLNTWRNGSLQTATIRTPVGFTNRANGQTASTFGISVSTRVASSEPSTYSNWTNGTGTPNGYAVIAAFSHAAYASVVAVSNGTTSSNLVPCPSVTATAGQLLVRFIVLSAATSDPGRIIPPAGMGWVECIDGTTGAVGSYMAARLITASGATGVENFDTGISTDYRICSMLLDPA